MRSEVGNKHNTFRMVLWLVVYYEFYEKKVNLNLTLQIVSPYRSIQQSCAMPWVVKTCLHISMVTRPTFV
jgi:hypothetical protein